MLKNVFCITSAGIYTPDAVVVPVLDLNLHEEVAGTVLENAVVLAAENVVIGQKIEKADTKATVKHDIRSIFTARFEQIFQF